MAGSGPVIIGGNGHSGTRVFCDIVSMGGIFTGIQKVTKRSASADLRILDLLNRWVEPYVNRTLGEKEIAAMEAQFSRRLRLYFPFRGIPWGFKNPRTMLILPFLDRLFPTMKFVHVIRDGRDISLGNAFVDSNRYVDAFLAGGERQLGPEERMILFWGRSNEAAWEYGTRQMGSRYLLMRWEDLCTNAVDRTADLLCFASCPATNAEAISRIVHRPKSLGRWRTYEDEIKERVASRGSKWLDLFGYGA